MIFNTKGHIPASEQSIIRNIKVLMQGKLFHMCMHLFYCSVLSLDGNVNTSRMSQPDMGSIFHKKNQWNNLVIGSYYVNYQNYQNLMLLSSSDTKRTIMHLFLFTNSTQRELDSICTQSIRNCNQLSLHYDLEKYEIWETTKRNLKQTLKKTKATNIPKFFGYHCILLLSVFAL